MLEEGYQKKFDLLLTKEISRFARNTLDSIYYTRKLKESGIGVIFLNDGINTLDADAELRLTIMASIAQEESRKTSVRVKWGQKRSMEQGVVFGRDLLGYKVKGGKLYIDLEEAQRVKDIFNMYLYEKKGVHTIARELTEKGVPTALHNKEWHGNVILKILKNEKYCGDLIQKKTYTPDFLLQEKKINTGQEEKVFLKNHHEPIIERKLFEQVQEEIHKRSKISGKKEKHTGKHCFSGVMKCGICGSSYVARKKTGKEGKEYRYWKCYEGVKHGKRHVFQNTFIGCDNMGISEEDLKTLLMEIIGSLCLKEDIITNLIQIIPNRNDANNVFGFTGKYEKEKLLMKKKKEKLLHLYLEDIIDKNEYILQKKAIELKLDYIYEKIETEKAQGIKRNASAGEYTIEVERLVRIIEGSEFNETFIRQLITGIIFNEGSIIIHLKYVPEPFIIKRIWE